MKPSIVNLEMSVKPFRDSSDECMDKVLSTLFEQWKPLCKEADRISVMLWTSDGSELLDYDGKLDSKFEWCKFIGVANAKFFEKKPDPNDPQERCNHRKPWTYMENPPERDYAWLKKLVSKIKSIGARLTGKPVDAVTTFDPGPEFAISEFKYKRHPEICMGESSEALWHFVCCYATLHADSRRYAAYPKGIPEGTPFGEFLGKQAQAFMTDMGFDAIWLSNGFGFGLEPWTCRGALFDGKRFSAEKTVETREKVLKFWRDFAKGCSFPIQTRGSNFPTGVDIASDAAPIREIYKEFKPQPPPNSPWAALNGNFGIEIGGWLSHIADTPGDGDYVFRYYIHDPWFKNSPWLDRYARESHDIHLPMKVSRIDASGEVRPASRISFLTVDDSFGRMPDKVPNEVIPHILEELDNAPDQPGPLVWLYPFDEIHDMVAEGVRHEEIFSSDWFVAGAINHGFPLNSVVSGGNFEKALKAKPGLFDKSILFAPSSTLSKKTASLLSSFVKRGGRALLYGPVANACEEIKELLGLEAAEPLEGAFKLESSLPSDAFKKGAAPESFFHDPLVSGGGLESVLAKGAKGVKALAKASRDGKERLVAISRSRPEWNGGKIAWLRATVSAKASSEGHMLAQRDPATNFQTESMARAILSEFGWDISFVMNAGPGSGDNYTWRGTTPITTAARCRNALFVAGYNPDLTVESRLKLPLGAPLFIGTETVLENGMAVYRMPKSWNKECRVFVEQESEGTLICHEETCEFNGATRRISVQGLKNATVRFLHEPNSERSLEFMLNSKGWPFVCGDDPKPVKRETQDGDFYEMKSVSGSLLISW